MNQIHFKKIEHLSTLLAGYYEKKASFHEINNFLKNNSELITQIPEKKIIWDEITATSTIKIARMIVESVFTPDMDLII